MVAVIKFSSSLRNVLHYNENKLKQEVKNEPKKMKAEFIHAANYGKDTDKLGFTDKFKHLEKQMKLNEGSEKSVVHISLNFDPSEKHDNATLKKIADVYMEKIGFGDQPYLVYKHNDSGHPHIHIVSTIIQNNGKRIKTHNIGRNQSEKARKEIEHSFNLIKADGHKQREVFQLKPVDAQKVTYGKSETKRAITNVLDAVLPHYKYTSLHELNAVLRLYNVVADRGSEESRIFKSGGLVYRVLDEKGNKIGVPIKASDIFDKPGLKFLKEKFTKNEALRQPYKQRIKNAVDLAFLKKVRSVEELQKTLQRERIQLVIRQNDKGIIYGLTYIDHQRKCVFNGSDLGKQYSANSIQHRCGGEQQQVIKNETLHQENKPETAYKHKPAQKNIPLPANENQQFNSLPLDEMQPDGKSILKELTEPERLSDHIPNQLKQKRKRKRKRLHL